MKKAEPLLTTYNKFMKNKAKLAFDLLEQEMEVICKEDQIRFIGGSGGYTWQQIVDAINTGI